MDRQRRETEAEKVSQWLGGEREGKEGMPALF